MNVGNAIITTVILYGGIEKYLKLPDSEAVFTGQDKQAWNWIKNSYAKYGQVPNEQMFRLNYPLETYRFDDQARTGAYASTHQLADIAREKILSLNVINEVGKAIDLHDQGKIAEAAAKLGLSDDLGTSGEAGWEPWNPDEWLNTEEPEIRRVGLVEGEPGLFYAGKTNTVIAESEAGKSWLGLKACADEMDLGNNVMFIDFEDSGPEIYTRLLNICDQEVILEHFSYFRPERPMPNRFIDQYCQDKTLIVIDGYGEALAMHGYKQDDEGVLNFNNRVSRPMSLAGAAVLLLDHFPKDKNNQDNAFGSVYKKNTVSGASYTLRNKEAFGEGRSGYSVLEVHKDRVGKIRKDCLFENGRYYAAELHVISDDPDLATDVKIKAVSARNFVTTNDFKVRVSNYMFEHRTASKTSIRENVKGSSDAIWNATEELITEGCLKVEGRKVEFVRQYKEAF